MPVFAHAARPDRNAYLNTAVTSVAGLVAEVKHDPEVADRYERHFEMTKSQLIDMFSHLHVTKLTQNTPVTMYSVPEGGAIKMHRSVMKKGTLVFEDAEGAIVLKVKCGNPVVPGQELTAISMPTDTMASASVIRNLSPDLVTKAEPNDIDGTISEPDTPSDVVAKTLVPPPNNTISNITTSSSTTTYAGGSSNGAFWGLLPLGALICVIATDHHSRNCCSNPTPAPEPLSMTMLGLGVAGLAVKRRRRQG